MTVCWERLARLWDSATGRPLTEWLDTGGRYATSACFDPTGQLIATANEDQVARVWQFPPAPTPVPEWFIAFAEAVAGVRLSAHANVELVPPQVICLLAEQVRHKEARDFYDRVAQWFLADPEQRAFDPF